jgi:hypothetical protein
VLAWRARRNAAAAPPSSIATRAARPPRRRRSTCERASLLRPGEGGRMPGPASASLPPYEGSGHRRVPHPAGRKAKECCPVSAVGPHRCRVTVSARCQNQDRRPPPRFTTPVAGLAAWKTRERWRDVPVVSHGSNPRAHQRSEALHDGALPICQSRRRIAGATDHEQRHSWCWLRQTLDRTGRTPSPWRH